MQISTTRLATPKHQPQAATSAPQNESASFHNEPHVPMDAVMRGYSDLDLSRAKDILGFAATGAIGGAAAGAISGGSGWMVPLSAATTSATTTAGVYADLKINGDDGYGGLALIAGGVAGGVSGAASGLIGFGLTALTGMNPIASGAVAGGLTGAALAFIG